MFHAVDRYATRRYPVVSSPTSSIPVATVKERGIGTASPEPRPERVVGPVRHVVGLIGWSWTAGERERRRALILYGCLR